MMNFFKIYYPSLAVTEDSSAYALFRGEEIHPIFAYTTTTIVNNKRENNWYYLIYG